MQSAQTTKTTQLKVVENGEPDLEWPVTCSGAEWADAVKSQNG